VLTNEMLAARMDTSDEWIVSRTGIRERRVVTPDTATGDLAVQAGAHALKSAEVDSVDAVVLATTTPDHRCPATAPSVAARLGLGRIAAYDVGAVCSGFLYGLASGAGLVSAGIADRVLVIGAEAFTTIIDPDDRTTAPIFGDGAGAVVLEAGDEAQRGALVGFDLGSDGDLADLIMIPAGGSRRRSSEAPGDQFMKMQGRPVFMNAVTRMVESTRNVLEKTGWPADSVDLLVGHQANVRILHAVADQLGLPHEKAFVNLDRYGNTAAASIPLALADAAGNGQLNPGDRVLLTAFGGGATWGAVALEWPRLRTY
jgi:3-oxoacyl-[acyl-carrier-protein] synthase-3